MKPLLIMLLFSTQVQANPFHEDPERIFDMKKSMITMSTITIEYVGDVQRRCNEVSEPPSGT